MWYNCCASCKWWQNIKKILAICCNIPFALAKAANDKFWGFQHVFPVLESGTLSLKTLVRYDELDHG
jgi:hypothetical protein